MTVAYLLLPDHSAEATSEAELRTPDQAREAIAMVD